MSKGLENASSGIPGLDDVLNGGFTPEELYLIEGVPGSGKTTLGMQFLLEGAHQGEKVLYLSLSESKKEIEQIAASHGVEARRDRPARVHGHRRRAAAW